jgi:hypothetical protein
MAKPTAVPRPIKRSEYKIVFASRQAQKGWRDMAATKLSALADAWDALTSNPLRDDAACHPLKGGLGTITVNGASHVRRQFELPGGARIWFYVTEGKPGTVHLVDVHTHHPNQTK